MHVWIPIEKKLSFLPGVDSKWKSTDFKCDICGLTKFADQDDSKLLTCEEQICRDVLEEPVISGWAANEDVGMAIFNPRGVTKLSL